MAACTCLLIAVTFPLWTLNSDIPDIPWFRWGVHVPPYVDSSILGLLLLLCLAGTVFPERRLPRHWFWPVYTTLLAALVLLDQNRLQVWGWEFLLLGVLGTCFHPQQMTSIARWLPVSIYFYSAISKLDDAFLFQAGPKLISELLQLDPLRTPAPWLAGIAWSLPLGELLIVLLLARASTQRWGLRVSLLMHATLILALGPLGLQHEWGVVLWNLYFIVQNLLLFRPCPLTPQLSATPQSDTQSHLPQAVTIGLLTYPALAWFAWCDPWPGWVVYSERPTQVIPLVNLDAIDQLPTALQQRVGPPVPFADWAPVNLDAQSFLALHAPMSPAAHYRGAVWLAETADLRDEHIGMNILLPPNRWTGTRESLELRGRLQIEHWVQSRWANTKPRNK